MTIMMHMKLKLVKFSLQRSWTETILNLGSTYSLLIIIVGWYCADEIIHYQKVFSIGQNMKYHSIYKASPIKIKL